MFWWNNLQVWSIERFFFIAAYCAVLFMLASMLYPLDFSNDLNCEEHFFANKSWFFGIQIAAFLLDIPETLAKGSMHLVRRRRPLPVRHAVKPVVVASPTPRRRK